MAGGVLRFLMDYMISFGMAVCGLVLALLAHLKSKQADTILVEAKRILTESEELRKMIFTVESISETGHHVLDINDLKGFMPK